MPNARRGGIAIAAIATLYVGLSLVLGWATVLVITIVLGI